jgi:hypothetical protein
MSRGFEYAVVFSVMAFLLSLGVASSIATRMEIAESVMLPHVEYVYTQCALREAKEELERRRNQVALLSERLAKYQKRGRKNGNVRPAR